MNIFHLSRNHRFEENDEMKKSLFLNLLVICSFLLMPHLLFCQVKATILNDSINAVVRKYQKEVALDCQGLFLRMPSAAAILKTRANGGQYVDVSSYKNNRFQIAFAGNLILDEESSSTDTFAYVVSQVPSFWRVAAMYGREKVQLYGKFNFYYGYDFGPFYEYRRSGYSALYLGNGSVVNTNYTWPPSESSKIGLTIVPFMGCKYRFSEHFSVSLETGVSIAYFKSKTTGSVFPFIKQFNSITRTNTTGIDVRADYIRFLTLNYHM